jgi:hypothetical protein
LTRTSALGDGVTVAFEEGFEDEAEVEAVERARQDPRMVNLRQSILDSIRGCIEVFGEDAGIGQVCLLFLLSGFYVIDIKYA